MTAQHSPTSWRIEHFSNFTQRLRLPPPPPPLLLLVATAVVVVVVGTDGTMTVVPRLLYHR
jgi:hypothetical protein